MQENILSLIPIIGYKSITLFVREIYNLTHLTYYFNNNNKKLILKNDRTLQNIAF